MDIITFRNLEKDDISLVKHWLSLPHIKKWYEPIDEWLFELENKDGKFFFLHHYVVMCKNKPIGFCQYYDCYFSKEFEQWQGQNIDKKGEVYSIDYLIGEECFLKKGYGKHIVRLLTEMVFSLGAKKIIVDPDKNNIASCRTLLANYYLLDKANGFYFRKNIVIRPFCKEDKDLLEHFLYLAVHVPQGMEPPSKDIIFLPQIYVYVDDFGKKDDFCLFAEMDGRVVGAAWSRILSNPNNRGYGNIDNKTPELALSVLPEFRGQGIGTTLLFSLFQLLSQNGYENLSLSVQKSNPAFRLYKRCGFEIIEEQSVDYIMLRRLCENTHQPY
jgi:ribosomal protein S18 acetylase RimI-like enzyme